MSSGADQNPTVLGVIGLGIVHELSSPLTSGMLALGLLAERLRGHAPPAIDDVADELDRVRGHLRRMADLIEHLRGLAAGEVRLAKHDLDAVADRATRLLEPMLRVQGGVRLQRGPRDPRARASIDGLLVEQAVSTVVLNAAEAMGHRQGVVTITTQRIDERARIEVLDEGPGFADPVAARAPGYTTKGAGRGIGLALAEVIVGASGGTLSLANRPEGGGQVILEFPSAD